MRSPGLLIAGVLVLGTTTLHAQPEVRDHRHGDARDHRTPPPPPGAGPTEAPPSPRDENAAARTGFVWIAGRWDWRGKWEWVAGHYERERAGKQWRPGHWDQNGTAWTYTDGAWIDGAATTPPPPPPQVTDHRPHQPPPPPRTETATAKPGFVWVGGRWDWRDDKWQWVDGHYERERAHKKWRGARWEPRDGAYVQVDGDWVDENAAEPPPVATPPPPPPTTAPSPGAEPVVRDHRRWTLDRPMVSSYWPTRGKAGARVRIHGKNFPASAMVVWADQPITGAKVTADEIMFDVPANATTGTIALRRDHGRDLIVGPFEVSNVDPEADAKRIEDERRKAAEAAWAAREKDLAKDRGARETAWKRHQQELDGNREQRRADRVAQIRAKWDAAFLGDADTQSELTLHAQRVAQLAHAHDLAEVNGNGKLVVRIDVATTKENERHDQRMQALQQAFKSKGGAP